MFVQVCQRQLTLLCTLRLVHCIFRTDTLLSIITHFAVLRLALSKEPSRVGVLLPSPGDGNGPTFRNVVFSSY
jgi:hypothetical protein